MIIISQKIFSCIIVALAQGSLGLVVVACKQKPLFLLFSAEYRGLYWQGRLVLISIYKQGFEEESE